MLGACWEHIGYKFNNFLPVECLFGAFLDQIYADMALVGNMYGVLYDHVGLDR